MNSNSFAAFLKPPLTCARVIAQDKGSYLLATEYGERRAWIKGVLLHENADPTELPVVGDYVAADLGQDSARIERVLPRKNLFARRSVWGSHCLQGIAANLDTLFITVAVNHDFNLRRIERFALSAAANAVPFAVLLTKADLVEEPALFVDAVLELLEKTPVLSVSIKNGNGLQAIAPFLGKGKTIAFAGSSGVGKSSLINTLLGRSVLEVKEIREGDERGRHTTTRRLLLEMPDGTAIIDTPGMREFGLADAEEGINVAFADIAGLAQDCRFSDCRHISEPGCAVRESLDEARLASYRKLEKEAAFEARKNDPLARSEERLKWKAIQKANRKKEKDKYKR